MAARHFFWDVGASGGVDGAADSDSAEGSRDERTEGGDAAGRDSNAVFDSGPDGDADSFIWNSLLVS